MAAPGAMLSGSLKRLSTRAGVATRNSFSALQTDSELPESSTLPELPPRRSPDSAPSGGSPPGLSSPREPSWRPVGRTPATKPGERRQGMEQLCGKFQRRAGCVRECCEQKHGATGLTGPLVGQRQDSSNNTRWLAKLQIGDFLSKPQTIISQSLNPAHARDASEPFQPGETPSPGMAQPQTKTFIPQSLNPAHARDASEPFQPGETPSPGMAQPQTIRNEYNDDDVMKKIEHATYLRNLDMVMTEVYQSSSNDDDAKRQDSVKKDPRPNIYEELNFLDADDDEELHSAETANNEFLDVEIEIAADSGASEHVAADTDAPTYKVEESAGSRSGQHFVGAGGHRMANSGQMKLDMRADNGRKGRDVRTTFQVARATRPLMSVSKICDAGMTMRFTSAMAVIEDNKGKEVCRFLRKGGLYIASMKLKNPNYKPPTMPFVRPGGK